MNSSIANGKPTEYKTMQLLRLNQVDHKQQELGIQAKTGSRMSYCVLEIISLVSIPSMLLIQLWCTGREKPLWSYSMMSCPLKFTEADHSLPCGCWFRQGYFVLGKGILVFQGQEVHDMFHLCLFLLTLTSIVILLSRLFILGKIWVGIKLDSRKVHHLYPTILQEFLFVDRDFAVGGIHPWVTVMVAITLIVTYPGPYVWQQ